MNREEMREKLLDALGVDRCSLCKTRMVGQMLDVLEREKTERADAKRAAQMERERPKSPGKRYTVPEEGVRLLDYLKSHEINLSTAATEMGIKGSTLSGSLTGSQRMSKNTMNLIDEYMAKKTGTPSKAEIRAELRETAVQKNLRGQDLAERTGAGLNDIMDMLEDKEPRNKKAYRLVREWLEKQER